MSVPSFCFCLPAEAGCDEGPARPWAPASMRSSPLTPECAQRIRGCPLPQLRIGDAATQVAPTERIAHRESCIQYSDCINCCQTGAASGQADSTTQSWGIGGSTGRGTGRSASRPRKVRYPHFVPSTRLVKRSHGSILLLSPRDAPSSTRSRCAGTGRAGALAASRPPPAHRTRAGSPLLGERGAAAAAPAGAPAPLGPSVPPTDRQKQRKFRAHFTATVQRQPGLEKTNQESDAPNHSRSGGATGGIGARTGGATCQCRRYDRGARRAAG